VPLAGHGLRPPPLRRRASRPQLKRDPLGRVTGHTSMPALTTRFSRRAIIMAPVGGVAIGIANTLYLRLLWPSSIAPNTFGAAPVPHTLVTAGLFAVLVLFWRSGTKWREAHEYLASTLALAVLFVMEDLHRFPLTTLGVIDFASRSVFLAVIIAPVAQLFRSAFSRGKNDAA